LDTRALWIQAERRDHGLTTRKIPGEKNLADLGTKAHPAKRFLEWRDMMGIVDCKRMDMSPIIEACSVEQDNSEVAQHLSGGWSTKTSRTAARLERQLLMTLLAAGGLATPEAADVMKYSTGAAGATVADDETSSGWLGWCVAALLTIVFVAHAVRERYEVRKRVRTRTMQTQSVTTYRTDLAAPRYQPLAEGSCGAWPMVTVRQMQGDRSL
jgi:hypothetical protein